MSDFDVDELPEKTIKMVYYTEDQTKLNLVCSDGSTFLISVGQREELIVKYKPASNFLPRILNT